MLCQFEKLLYPKDAHAASAGSYMVAVYRPCEIVRDSSGSILPQFKAVGYFLPVSNHLRYDMKGHWSRNTKHGTQFEVDSYDEVIIPSREGIIGYLSSGQIKGIGPRIAEKIYDAYGNLALEVLDKEPDKLLGIPGISQTRLTKICDSYLANRAARDVVAFLTPYGITANRAVKLYKEYGKEAMSIVKEHPYQLCELAGIGFKTADRIASSVGFTPLSTERVDAALLYTLTEAESRGHLCMEKHAFIKSCSKLLGCSQTAPRVLYPRAILSPTWGWSTGCPTPRVKHLSQLIFIACSSLHANMSMRIWIRRSMLKNARCACALRLSSGKQSRWRSLTRSALSPAAPVPAKP